MATIAVPTTKQIKAIMSMMNVLCGLEKDILLSEPVLDPPELSVRPLLDLEGFQSWYALAVANVTRRIATARDPRAMCL